MTLMTKKQRKMSKSGDIPHDILLQVLERLPAQSLLRFKSVCKLWHSIISDPQFVESHERVSETRLGGNYFVTFWQYRDAIMISFLDHDGRRRVPPPMQLKLNPTTMRAGRIAICPPVNGLVCLSSFTPTDGHALVLNITTRQIVHLPPPKRASTLVLGFDQMTKGYKVLNWYFDHDYLRGACAIYSLGADTCWREIRDPPSIPYLHSCCALNGSIYWLIVKPDNTFLMAFECGKEVFRTLKFTEHVKYSSRYDDNRDILYAVGKGLAWIKHYGAPEVWLLEVCEDDNQVRVKEKISIPPDLVKGPTFKPERYPIPKGISPTGELAFLYANTSRKVYLDLKEKTFRLKRFKWHHPRKGVEDKRWTSLRYKVRYNHVENICRFKVQDDVSDRHGSCFVL